MLSCWGAQLVFGCLFLAWYTRLVAIHLVVLGGARLDLPGRRRTIWSYHIVRRRPGRSRRTRIEPQRRANGGRNSEPPQRRANAPPPLPHGGETELVRTLPNYEFSTVHLLHISGTIDMMCRRWTVENSCRERRLWMNHLTHHIMLNDRTTSSVK